MWQRELRLWGDALRAVLVPWLTTRSAVWLLLWYGSALPRGQSGPETWPGVASWLAPFIQFDSLHYLSIATAGYMPEQTVWFPVYPLLIRAFSLLAPAPLVAVLISNAAGLLAFAACYRLIRETHPDEDGAARWTVWALLLWPTSLFFSAAYTESLFLLFASLALLYGHRRQWLVAGLFAGLSALTRNVGAAVFLALAVHAALSHRDRLDSLLRAWAAVIPGGLMALLYPAWLWLRFGDPLLFLRFQFLWQRSLQLPTTAIWWELSFTVTDPHRIRWLIYAPTLVAVALTVGLALRWRQVPTLLWTYGLVAALMGIVNPVAPTAGIHPLMSFDRYILAAFPALLSLRPVLVRHPRAQLAAIAIAVGWGTALTAMFGMGIFVE